MDTAFGLTIARTLEGMAMSWQRVDRPDDVKPWFLRDSPAYQLVPELH